VKYLLITYLGEKMNALGRKAENEDCWWQIALILHSLNNLAVSQMGPYFWK
jgi:hypothetical protein